MAAIDHVVRRQGGAIGERVSVDHRVRRWVSLAIVSRHSRAEYLLVLLLRRGHIQHAGPWMTELLLMRRAVRAVGLSQGLPSRVERCRPRWYLGHLRRRHESIIPPA